MNRTKLDRSVMMMITIAAVGLTVDSVSENWEFWVNPLLVAGVLGLWAVHFSNTVSLKSKEILYLGFGMFLALFHGVHETSLFDVSIVSALMLVLFSLYDKLYVLNLIMAEYIFIMASQFLFVIKPGELVFDTMVVSRLVLQTVIVISIFFICRMMVIGRQAQAEIMKKRLKALEDYDTDMEDFLSNISHELRTPVNVVNGMVEIMIKNDPAPEAFPVRKAGIRLTNQIEGIQDYIECKRDKVILEEEDYMSTSLINDVVTDFRVLENEKNLELVVDLDPKVPTTMRGDIKKLHKIFRHLLENAVKFTRQGGISVRLYAEEREYGVNLIIEMTDTGIGMDLKTARSVSEGMYQAEKGRNRATGGVGLGLFIVFGFAHSMGGFVKVESEKMNGTTVRVTVPQKIVDDTPCISAPETFSGDILFHVRSDKYKVPKVRDFYRAMAANLAAGIHVPLYPAETTGDIDRLREKLDITYIFMGQEEYEDNPEFFDSLSKEDIVVTVSAGPGFEPRKGSKVVVMPKPLYAYPVIKVLHDGKNAGELENAERSERPSFTGARALVVDDEPMNLVVAVGLFKEYGMIVDTASGGKESVSMFRKNDYDIVFMDHMMPEMDGVEAMRQIRKAEEELGKKTAVVALTANVVSGAREMFMNEGFDGFIAKPVNIADFERVMLRVLPGSKVVMGGKA